MMRSIIMMILTTLLILFLCACDSTPPNTQQETTISTIAAEETSVPEEALETSAQIDLVEPTVPALEFPVLLEEFSAQHKTMVESNAALDSIDQHLVVNKEDVYLLTDDEIKELLTEEASPAYLTYEEAAYDVDVLFRAFRSAYGAYYYFGEEFFENGQAEILDWLTEYEKLESSLLQEKLTGFLLQLADAHTYIMPSIQEEPLRYKYYYTDLYFAKDDSGYYKYKNGEKYYWNSFDDSRVQMACRLTAEGDIVYSPVLFCLPAEMHSSTVVLKNEAGKTTEETLSWVLSQPYGESYRTPDFKLLEENGIAYLSVRCFNSKYESGELAQFTASGKDVKDAELIIFDIRSNGGGRDTYGKDWIKNFCGQIPKHTNVHTTRISLLRNAWNTSQGGYPDQRTLGSYRKDKETGKQLENDIPIIVLVDDTCGSAGESMLNGLRCLDNVIIIGSNSAGYQLCGNQMVLNLPHSNIACAFGASLQFHFTDENVDYKGYEPDIWCNPVDALDAVFNMILRYDLADADSVENLRTDVANAKQNEPPTQQSSNSADNLGIRWRQNELYPGHIFGSISENGVDAVYVHINGEAVTDFTVRSEAPEFLEVGTMGSDRINLKRLKPFEGIPVGFTITYNGNDYTFYCADSTYVP